MGPLASLAGGANSPRVSSAKRPVARVLDYSDIDVHAPPSLGKFADVDAAPTAADPSAAPPPIALQASLEVRAAEAAAGRGICAQLTHVAHPALAPRANPARAGGTGRNVRGGCIGAD